ncbi:MAG: helix-turn-helix domain-containing protein [Pseudomonadota bacterium]|nr:helix-turn-helix domain-containing protein [Pseudomonadota bacterium]
MNTLSNASALLGEDPFREIQLKHSSLKIKRWLRTDEVALYLGSTREAVKKLYQRGKLAAHKFCGRLYFDRELLDQLIERSHTGHGPVESHSGINVPQPRGRKRWELKKL